MYWLVWILGGLLLTLSDLDLFYTAQRGGYRVKEYASSITLKTYAPPVLATVASVACVYVLRYCAEPWDWQFLGLLAPILCWCAYVWTRRHVPPLRFTPRCLRLVGTVLALDFVLLAATAAGAFAARDFVAVAAFAIAAQVFVLPLAMWILHPVERGLARRFERAARVKLARIAPQVIAVTGSYGKTSVKNFLRDLLSVRYRVCASPENYNTPTGLCITINDFLKDGDEIVIAEMGARYRGDIAELCRLAPPDAAVVTGIGTQHLATFGSAETLRDTKYEIVEALRGGPAFFGEGEGCRALYDRGYENAHLAGDARDEYSVRFEDVGLGREGSSFTLTMRGSRIRATTRLLGAEHLANLRLACTVAVWLGLTAEELAEGIARVRPVPHRLELLPSAGGGVRVIDDSYNASAEGIAAAAKVLALFPPARAAITPGIVEAGADAYAVNYRAGGALAAAADELWFYGPNVDALRDGALGAGLEEEHIHIVKSRDAAVNATSALSVPRVVLFCNDLPV